MAVDADLDTGSRPKPSLREKGYVSGKANPHSFSQWEEFERVPDLQWPASVETFTRMVREDSRVSSMYTAITLPIRRTPWRIDPAGARDEVAEFVARNLNLPVVGEGDAPRQTRTRGRFSWAQHLQQALTSLIYGHSVFEQVYWPANADGMVELRKLASRPQRTIADWHVALDGGLVSIEQYAPASDAKTVYGIAPVTLPINRLVVYTRDMEPGQWVGNSLLRPSYKHWLLKDELIRYQAVAIRRNGMGVPIGESPEGASQEEVDKLAEIAQSYRGGDNAGAALPAGAKLNLLGVQGNLPDIQAAIAYHDNMIAIAGLAHFLNLSGGGSYALASVQADTFVQSVQTFAESIRDIAQSHVVEDIVDINWGTSEPAPRLVFDEIGSRTDATAASLKMLVEAGLLSPSIFDEQAVRQRLGFPAKPADEPVATPQTPGLAPVAGSGRRRKSTAAQQEALF